MPVPTGRTRGLLLVLILLAWLATAAEAQAPEGGATAEVEVKETTEVLGSVPADLVGRWLAVGQIKLEGGAVRPVARAFEIRQGPEHLELVLQRGPLPDRVNNAIQEAGADQKAWTPTEQDLRAVAESWGTPPTVDAGYAKIEHKILAADAYPPEFQADEVSKDSQLAIATHEFFAGRQSVVRTYAVYAIRARTPTTLSGTFLTSSLAIAPMPIPITLKGDFQAYRIGGSAAGGSWLSRLFSGCQRR